MTTRRPNFVDSEYLVKELFNWHLKEGAPVGVVKEFEDWKKQVEIWRRKNVMIEADEDKRQR